MALLLALGVLIVVYDQTRSPVTKPRRPKIVEQLRDALLEQGACPDCLGVIKGGACGCGADHSVRWEELTRPRCRACKSHLFCCDVCGMGFCGQCQSGPFRCPRCGRIP